MEGEDRRAFELGGHQAGVAGGFQHAVKTLTEVFACGVFHVCRPH
jgi:hypothetical protein